MPYDSDYENGDGHMRLRKGDGHMPVAIVRQTLRRHPECGRMASFDTWACSVCSRSFGESYTRCGQHVNAVHGSCRKQGALAKRVPVVIGRNDRNVGGRRLLDIDSDSEADAPANPPQAGCISNLPVDSDLDDAGGGGPETDPESDSGRYSLLIHRDLFISIHGLFISILYLIMAYSLLIH